MAPCGSSVKRVALFETTFPGNYNLDVSSVRGTVNLKGGIIKLVRSTFRYEAKRSGNEARHKACILTLSLVLFFLSTFVILPFKKARNITTAKVLWISKTS